MFLSIILFAAAVLATIALIEMVVREGREPEIEVVSPDPWDSLTGLTPVTILVTGNKALYIPEVRGLEIEPRQGELVHTFYAPYTQGAIVQYAPADLTQWAATVAFCTPGILPPADLVEESADYQRRFEDFIALVGENLPSN